MSATVNADRLLVWQAEESKRCERRRSTGRGPRPARKPKATK